MLDEEYQALRSSIRSGYDNNKPIELFDGKILDGRHRYQACNDEKIDPRFITLTDIDPYDYVRKVHEGRRSWSNQVQKALVIGELLKMSDEFQSIQQQIRDEANRKRAEATKAQDFKGNQYTVIETQKEVVVPQAMAPPPKPTPPISINPVYTPPPKAELPEQPKPAKQPERTTAVIATKIGVNRGAVEQAQTIQEKRPDLADKVKSGEMKPGEALRQIKKDQFKQTVKEAPVLAEHGGDHTSEESKATLSNNVAVGNGRPKDSSFDNVKAKGGNDSTYLTARLKRDAPEIATRLERGEFKSVKEAPVLAEHRRPTKEEQDKGAINTFKRGSTNATYLTARLKRDAPDIAARLERGE